MRRKFKFVITISTYDEVYSFEPYGDMLEFIDLLGLVADGNLEPKSVFKLIVRFSNDFRREIIKSMTEYAQLLSGSFQFKHGNSWHEVHYYWLNDIDVPDYHVAHNYMIRNNDDKETQRALNIFYNPLTMMALSKMPMDLKLSLAKKLWNTDDKDIFNIDRYNQCSSYGDCKWDSYVIIDYGHIELMNKYAIFGIDRYNKLYTSIFDFKSDRLIAKYRWKMKESREPFIDMARKTLWE